MSICSTGLYRFYLHWLCVWNEKLSRGMRKMLFHIRVTSLFRKATWKMCCQKVFFFVLLCLLCSHSRTIERFAESLKKIYTKMFIRFVGMHRPESQSISLNKLPSIVRFSKSLNFYSQARLEMQPYTPKHRVKLIFSERRNIFAVMLSEY